jgi:hypothetical protein
MLRNIHAGARNKQKTDILLKIVSSNYALLMFDIIERAKCQLSGQRQAEIDITTDTFTIRDRVTRAQFEAAIHTEYEQIRSELLATLDRSGLSRHAIDRVVRTGGSSQIPLFNQLLNELFGEGKVQAIDTFSSVTSGLGIMGYMLEHGETEAEAWTADRLSKTESITRSDAPGGSEHRPGIQEVDLEAIRRQLAVTSEFLEGREALPDEIWVVLGEDRLEVSEEIASPSELGSQDWLWVKSVCRGKPGQHLLSVTDSYKLQSIELAALYIASMGGVSGALQLFTLETMDSVYPDEQPIKEMVTTGAVWEIEQPRQPYLSLVTNTGQLRSFDSQLLAEHIRPRPFFQLEKRYTGIPFALLPAVETGIIMAGTNKGRIGKAMVRQSQVVTLDILRTKKDERVCTARAFPNPDRRVEGIFWGIDAQGSGIAFALEDVIPAGLLLNRNFHPVLILTQAEIEEGTFKAFTSAGRLLIASPSQPGFKAGVKVTVFHLDHRERIIGGFEDYLAS